MLTETYFLSQGMKPYSQVNDVHFPGIMLLPVNLYTLGIRTVWHLRVVHAFLLVSNLFLVALTLTKTARFSPFKTTLALISYIFLFFLWEGNILWIDSFVTTLSLLGFYLLINGWHTKSMFNTCIVGLIFGLVLLFKQHGIFICLSATLWIYLSTKSITRMLVLTVAWVLPMGISLLYLTSLGVFDDFFFWTFLHNLQGYVSLEGKSPSPFSLVKLLLPLIPAIGGILLSPTTQYRFLILIYLVATLFYNFPRFELLHSQVALPLVILGLILLFDLTRSPLKYVSLACILSSWLLAARFFSRATPGKVYFYADSSKATIDFARQNVSPGQTIYVYGVNDNLYHLSQTLPPGKTWIELLPGNIIPGVQEVIIGTLIQDPPKLVLVDPNSTVDGKSLKSFTPKIWHHIQANYVTKSTLANQVQVWVPRTL